jgi:hypothetical protein
MSSVRYDPSKMQNRCANIGCKNACTLQSGPRGADGEPLCLTYKVIGSNQILKFPFCSDNCRTVYLAYRSSLQAKDKPLTQQQ